MALRTPEQKIRDAKKQADLDKEHRALALAASRIFGSDDGQRVLKWMQRKGFLYTTTLATPHPDVPIDPIQSWANAWTPVEAASQ